MLSGERILVAEDECMIALDLTDTLERAGASVIGPAATVQEVLKLAMSETPDRALLDFNLADGEVTPVLELLASKGVPVVVYTGRGLPPELMARHPDLTILRKPVPHRQLVAELAAAKATVSHEMSAEWAFPACGTEVTQAQHL
jgi:DNA-binding response OmpR family regulator